MIGEFLRWADGLNFDINHVGNKALIIKIACQIKIYFIK